MRESKFVDQNKTNWTSFETALKDKTKDPEALYKLFTQVTDDLSYSRTFYKNRSVRTYLNALAQQSFFKIYRSVHLDKWSGFKLFWSKELPLSIWASRQSILLSLLVFVVAVAIGAISTAKSPEFARQILGNDYIDMTLKNISNGDPMGVYKDANIFGMTLGITVNNIMVSFFAYLLGMLWGVGTLMLLIRNGIMLGCFQYFFYEKGLLKEMLLTIWLHGTLEISAIIIAGGAGFVLAKGLVMPGTYTRIQAFRTSARKGLTIMVGLVPVFILAGFIEGFITRHTEMFWGFKLALILLSLFFILFLYAYYPYLVHKATPTELETYESTPISIKNINFQQVKGGAQIVSESFMLYFGHAKTYLKSLFGYNLLYFTIGLFCYNYLSFGGQLAASVGTFGMLKAPFYISNILNNTVIFGVSAIVLTFVVVSTQYRESTKSFRQLLTSTSKSIVFVSMALWCFRFSTDWYVLLGFAFLATIPLLTGLFILESTNGLMDAVSRTVNYLGKGVYLASLQFGLFVVFFGFLLFFLYDNFLWEQVGSFISWHIPNDYLQKQNVMAAINHFFIGLIFLFLWQYLSLGIKLIYHSSLEVHEATGLRTFIQQWAANDKKSRK